jgi:hypothetical protein
MGTIRVPGGAVGRATGYGFEFWYSQEFSHLRIVQTGSGGIETTLLFLFLTNFVYFISLKQVFKNLPFASVNTTS